MPSLVERLIEQAVYKRAAMLEEWLVEHVEHKIEYVRHRADGLELDALCACGSRCNIAFLMSTATTITQQKRVVELHGTPS